MGDIARCSMQNEDLLYKLFGVQAELLIDHAWGFESCTMAHIKAYRPTTNSLSSGQVLHCPYTNQKAKLIVREMADAMSLDLVDKALATDQITLTIGYDTENVKLGNFKGEVVRDHYGRDIPRHGHGTANLGEHTASTRQIVEAVSELYDRITDPALLVRRITLCANHVLPEARLPESHQQLDLFTDPEAQAQKEQSLAREKRRQKAVVTIQKRFGKNAIFKGMSLEEGATAMDRNRQIGGHKA